ncbi:MAG: adenylyl-sulfate kinase [Flavobacteriales bacterium]|nr:adenylyl-sulfate kinase [Flavobacteriales bacterium]
MKEEKGNIFTVFDEVLSRSEKETRLGQKGCVIWMTGLSGSGKTTLAKWLENKLFAEGVVTMLLDGDNIRAGLNNDLGFTENDRVENIRRIAEVAKLFKEAGIVTIASFVSPTIKIRIMAKQIIGENDFFEIFVNTPIELCEARDVKGLYKKARAGEIKDFTGISAPFEKPETPSLDLRTENKSIERTGEELYSFIIKKIKP